MILLSAVLLNLNKYSFRIRRKNIIAVETANTSHYLCSTLKKWKISWFQLSEKLDKLNMCKTEQNLRLRLTWELTCSDFCAGKICWCSFKTFSFPDQDLLEDVIVDSCFHTAQHIVSPTWCDVCLFRLKSIECTVKPWELSVSRRGVHKRLKQICIQILWRLPAWCSKASERRKHVLQHEDCKLHHKTRQGHTWMMRRVHEYKCWLYEQWVKQRSDWEVVSW